MVGARCRATAGAVRSPVTMWIGVVRIWTDICAAAPGEHARKPQRHCTIAPDCKEARRSHGRNYHDQQNANQRRQQKQTSHGRQGMLAALRTSAPQIDRGDCRLNGSDGAPRGGLAGPGPYRHGNDTHTD